MFHHWIIVIVHRQMGKCDMRGKSACLKTHSISTCPVAYSADPLTALTKTDLPPTAGQNEMKVSVRVWRSGWWLCVCVCVLHFTQTTKLKEKFDCLLICQRYD